MRIIELTESLSKVAYHFTRLWSANKILEDRGFKLTASVGTASERFLKTKDKFWFLSTTRSKLGDYTTSSSYNEGVVLVLNGNWFNRHYTSRPVDYWGRQTWGKDEAEDRVFSSKPFIRFPDKASDAITAIHVLYRSDADKPNTLRRLLLNAKLLEIPVYVYDNAKDWLLQRTDNSVPLTTEFLQGLKQPENKSYPSLRTDWLKPYRELWYQTDRTKLSNDAKQKLRSLPWYEQDLVRSLEADIHNVKVRATPGLTKLLKIFRSAGISTPKEFVELLVQKWADRS